mmetsp:Transcript_33964/g.112415  ORF Transcript_33964/g.112415 Transcript_33964/m.112415 type:complete len:248 (-) Transcript_33964:1035-1778(-)
MLPYSRLNCESANVSQTGRIRASSSPHCAKLGRSAWSSAQQRCSRASSSGGQPASAAARSGRRSVKGFCCFHSCRCCCSVMPKLSIIPWLSLKVASAFLNISGSPSPGHGSARLATSNITMLKLNTSLALLYLPLNVSGAFQASVPAPLDSIERIVSIVRAIPKSATFGTATLRSAELNSTFAAFRSRWMSGCGSSPCSSAIPAAMPASQRTRRAHGSNGQQPRSLSTPRSPPGTGPAASSSTSARP